MFCFAIVDDDKNVLSIISNFINDYQKQKKILQIELKEYEFPDLFLKSYKKGDFQLIFLDINMEPINGIQLAKEIRLIDNKVFFVFVSGHNQYFQYALNLHTFDYLLKPVMKNKFQRVLEDYFLHLHEVRYV